MLLFSYYQPVCLLSPVLNHHSLYLGFAINFCRCDTSGTTSSKVSRLREGCLSPAEPPSCGFLRRVDGTVGEPVHSSEHPASALSHTRAHRCLQQGINTTKLTWGLNSIFEFAVQVWISVCSLTESTAGVCSGAKSPDRAPQSSRPCLYFG